jgi:hypothetical protein
MQRLYKVYPPLKMDKSLARVEGMADQIYFQSRVLLIEENIFFFKDFIVPTLMKFI